MKLHSFNRHKGITFVGKVGDLLEPSLLGNVLAYNLVRNPRRRKALDTHISDYYWHRRMMSAFSMKTVVADVQNPGFTRSFFSASGRAMLNGAAGSRVRNFARKNLEFSDASLLYFSTLYAELSDLEDHNSRQSNSDTCWIEVKNFYNFFHFLTESFHRAFTGDRAGYGVKKIIFKSRSERVEPFAARWIEDCKDLINGEVEIEAGKGEFSDEKPVSVLMPMSAQHLLYQFSGPHHDILNAARPPGHSWTGYDSSPHSVKIVGMNTFDDSLRTFRDAVVGLAKQKIPGKWGKKIYVARSSDLLRRRVMKGEVELMASLQKRGFEVVYFEKLSPLEQVRCVSGARCIVMQHGAGMTNMLFASKNAHVFELGTYQTAMARWSDFIPLCHVAQCHYHHIFLDMDFDKDDVDPIFMEDGLIAPVICPEDVDQITSIIVEQLKDKSDGDVGAFLTHSRYLMDREAYRQAYRLLDAVEPLGNGYGEYWERRAQLDAKCGHRKSACNNYAKSWRISNSPVSKAEFMQLATEEDRLRHPDLM